MAHQRGQARRRAQGQADAGDLGLAHRSCPPGRARGEMDVRGQRDLMDFCKATSKRSWTALARMVPIVEAFLAFLPVGEGGRRGRANAGASAHG